MRIFLANNILYLMSCSREIGKLKNIWKQLKRLTKSRNLNVRFEGDRLWHKWSQYLEEHLSILLFYYLRNMGRVIDVYVFKKPKNPVNIVIMLALYIPSTTFLAPPVVSSRFWHHGWCQFWQFVSYNVSKYFHSVHVSVNYRSCLDQNLLLIDCGANCII